MPASTGTTLAVRLHKICRAGGEWTGAKQVPFCELDHLRAGNLRKGGSKATAEQQRHAARRMMDEFTAFG